MTKMNSTRYSKLLACCLVAVLALSVASPVAAAIRGSGRLLRTGYGGSHRRHRSDHRPRRGVGRPRRVRNRYERTRVVDWCVRSRVVQLDERRADRSAVVRSEMGCHTVCFTDVPAHPHDESRVRRH